MNKSSENSLNKVIAACKLGHRWAQKELYHRYYSYGLTVCLHYLPQRQLAEEALHDAFLKTFKCIDQLDDVGAFQAWFRRIAVRSAIDQYRKKNKWGIIEELIPTDLDETEENEAIVILEMADVILLLQQLSPQYRMVFNLFVLEGFSHEEISKLLKISVGTSKSNLARAKQKLRKMLRSEETIYKGFY